MKERHTMGRKQHWIATALSCLVLLWAKQSSACGGCFAPPRAATVVTGHRMAFAVSPERTVLWDQIRYEGAPEEFSWVLPVKPGAFIEASRDAWFEALESVTQTNVTAPQLTCAIGFGSSGCGCGAAQAESNAAGFGPSGDTNGVRVLHEGTVGPYETVTLRSDDGDALSGWLDSHGYSVPPNIDPIIAAYVSEGSDFIALRLKPGAQVQQMTPVRVVTQGGEGLLPLRMVAAGVGDSVEIVLYLIGESRFDMPDLHEVSVDAKALSWDFAANQSNYAELRRQALARNLGFSYLTTFAQKKAFSKTFGRSTFIVDNLILRNFADVYFARAGANDPAAATPGCKLADVLDRGELVAAADSSETIASSRFHCGGADDIESALIGMHPDRLWLTRFELDLPREALSMDCMVRPSDSLTEISSGLVAAQSSNRPASCDQLVFESRISPRPPSALALWLAAAGIAGSAWVRRRRRANARGDARC